ncbi:hypothetical protein [Micromonospora sp. NPDC049274]|uniref:hypothetical protein n=1 Tax=Micromonospora sp. NPDC049274 TaxID=3154829 RepID=UPI0034272272
MTATDPYRVVEAVWRIEAAHLIAKLTRILRDVGLAEEIAQDTLVIRLNSGRSRACRRIPGRG